MAQCVIQISVCAFKLHGCLEMCIWRWTFRLLWVLFLRLDYLFWRYVNEFLAFFSAYHCLRDGKMSSVKEITWNSDLKKYPFFKGKVFKGDLDMSRK